MTGEAITIERAGRTCPVCGYGGLQQAPYAYLNRLPVPDGFGPPYDLSLGLPSYEVCDCCGFEFGNDDEPGTAKGISFEDYRQDWLSEGAPWFSPSKRPPDWSLEAQLASAGLPSP